MGICSPSPSDSTGRISTYTSTTRPTSGVDFYVGKVIFESDTNKLMICTSISAGGTWREIFDGDGWVSYTPAIAGTGFAVVNGAVAGYYRRFITHVEFFAIWLYGSTDTSGAGPLTISTPVTTDNTALGSTGVGPTQAGLSGGGGWFYDLSATTYYPLYLLRSNNTKVEPRVITYNGAAAGTAYATLTGLTSTIPIAPATGDIYVIYGQAFTS